MEDRRTAHFSATVPFPEVHRRSSGKFGAGASGGERSTVRARVEPCNACSHLTYHTIGRTRGLVYVTTGQLLRNTRAGTPPFRACDIPGHAPFAHLTALPRAAAVRISLLSVDAPDLGRSNTAHGAGLPQYTGSRAL
ncbi:hypothetical protein A0H81_05185 [Grifola frondosa]|uniref:Uncharacterized protein n=1 Tax=Grifola frondosa TaxID=5627 RepID=A0A1C7MEX4_GRIFR|nr:hypothetical protein A0H81_05185 [Grifola frondosa]